MDCVAAKPQARIWRRENEIAILNAQEDNTGPA